MANLGFVGLGVMGGQMVDRLMNHGHTVTGYNRTRAKAQWLIDKGMTFARFAAGRCGSRRCHAFDGHQLRGARSSGGRSERHTRGTQRRQILIDMSTVSPAVSRRWRRRCGRKARTWSMRRFRAASITLQQGKLSVMVGGSEETFERVKPLLPISARR